MSNKAEHRLAEYWTSSPVSLCIGFCYVVAYTSILMVTSGINCFIFRTVMNTWNTLLLAHIIHTFSARTSFWAPYTAAEADRHTAVECVCAKEELSGCESAFEWETGGNIASFTPPPGYKLWNVFEEHLWDFFNRFYCLVVMVLIQQANEVVHFLRGFQGVQFFARGIINNSPNTPLPPPTPRLVLFTHTHTCTRIHTHTHSNANILYLSRSVENAEKKLRTISPCTNPQWAFVKSW